MSEGALATTAPAGRQPLLRFASDARLVRLAATGSTPAFAAIYERHHQAIYRYCRSILNSEEDARDALQNTMLKAMRALDGETREISLRPWLFRIAHNEAIGLVRRRRTEAPVDELAEEPASADTNLAARERLRELIGDLDQLSPRQRSALVMRELNGLSFSELATALETSPEGAKQSVYEARVALQEIQEGREMDCGDVRRKLSEQDGRMLRGRHMRAHLKGCTECRAFKDAIGTRRGQLAMIAPPLPLPIALHLLDGILGGGGGSGGAAAGAAGGGAAAAAAGGAGSGAAGLGAGALAKVGIAGALALGGGAAAIEVADSRNPWSQAEAAMASRDDGDELSSGPAQAGSRPQPARAKDGSGTGAESARSGNASRGADAGGSAGGQAAGGAAGAGQGGDSSPGPGDGAQGAAPGQGSSPANSDAPAAAAAPVPGDGGPPESAGPSGTPPGQGGTPPGQGGTPPGLTAPPPGLGGTPPGHGGTPPGQATTPPGQSATPPGPPATPPGHSASPPGPPATPPGQLKP